MVCLDVIFDNDFDDSVICLLRGLSGLTDISNCVIISKELVRSLVQGLTVREGLEAIALANRLVAIASLVDQAGRQDVQSSRLSSEEPCDRVLHFWMLM